MAETMYKNDEDEQNLLQYSICVNACASTFLWSSRQGEEDTALQKASDIMGSAAKPNPEQQASVLNQLGNVYAEEGKPTDASAAYDKAVALQPKSAGTYYYNEAAVMFNAHQDEPALAAAEKAIAADPNQPMPYYIKGQELLAKATVDAKGTR